MQNYNKKIEDKCKFLDLKVISGEYAGYYVKNLLLENLDGYKILTNYSSIVKLKSLKSILFSKYNEYSIYNIKTWVKNNNKNFIIIDTEYENNSKKMNIKCNKCGSVFKTSWNKIKQHRGCPFCSGRVVNNTNSLRVTHPHILKYLKKESDSDIFSKGSNRYIDIICPVCKTEYKKKVCNFVNKNFHCHKCSSGISIPEKFCRSILNELHIDYECQKVFTWSNRKLYDFYIPSLNIIIETHGEQHYDKTFESLGGRNLEEERLNDAYKEKLAKDNGIEKYITINCRKSDFEWLKENFINSLNSNFDIKKVNFYNVKLSISNDLTTMCSDLYNNLFSVNEISKKLKINKETVSKYLQIAKELDMCNYIKKINLPRAVYQYDKNYNFISEFESSKYAEIHTGVNKSHICQTCNDKRKSAGGFIWSYTKF